MAELEDLLAKHPSHRIRRPMLSDIVAASRGGRGSRVVRGRFWTLTERPRVYITGTLWRYCLPADNVDDVRELVCERIRPDVYADWSDPREWASLTSRQAGRSVRARG